MPKLFAGSLMKGRDFTWQQIFGLCIFPTTGSQRNYSRAVALLDCTALLLVAHAKGQEHVPVARAIDVATEDISHHLGEDLQVPDPTTTLNGSSGVCAAASPHPWHSSVPKSGGAQPIPIISETATVGWRAVRCFALTVREKDWLFWATRAATQRFATSFCLLPSRPITCEPAGWFHQLWPAAWRVSKLIKFLRVSWKPFEDTEPINCPGLLPDLCP